MIAFGMADPQKAEEMSKQLDQIPLRRVGDPEKDIGPVAVFLACEDSDFITGHTFMVDGGAHMF
jgi:NAD(P)-dependent dehydrogenase (short-subunit alcohol dehydrogenase family)